MKKIIGIIFSVLFIVLLAGCSEKTSVEATFTDVEIEQTAITFTVVIDDPEEEITGGIIVKLFKADGTLSNSKEIATEADLIAIKFTALDNQIAYTVKVYATMERDSLMIGEKVFELASAVTQHITTTDEFLAMKTNRAGNFVLDNDLDFTGTTFVSPFTSSFSGTFDGMGFSIKNVTFGTAATYTGVFGYVSSGTIKNLVLDNVTIGSSVTPLLMSTSSRIGILAGYVSSAAAVIENITITNSEINVTTSSTVQAYVGGIVGENKASIIGAELSNVNIHVKSLSYGKIKLGGAVGYMTEDSILKEVKSDANVSFELAAINTKNKDIQANVGGLIGDHNARNISKSVENIFSTGDVDVTLDFGTLSETTSGIYSVYVGGLAGIAYSNIINAFYGGSMSLTHEKNEFEAETTKTFYLGGLVGFYGSNKAMTNTVRVSDSNTITATVSDDVNLKTSQTFGQKSSTAVQVAGVYGDIHLEVNGVSVAGADTSTVYLTLVGYFTGDWMQDAFDAVYPA